MKILVLIDPQKMLVELFEFFKDSSLSRVLQILLSHFDDRVDNFHDELGVVWTIHNLIAALPELNLHEVVFRVIKAVDFRGKLSYPWSAS